MGGSGRKRGEKLQAKSWMTQKKRAGVLPSIRVIKLWCLLFTKLKHVYVFTIRNTITVLFYFKMRPLHKEDKNI